MAQKTQVILVDDTDGSTGDETVIFGIDGAMYEIDLSASNARRMRDSFDEWIKYARKISNRRGRPRKKVDPQTSTKIRKWARANGYDIQERGRISAEIQQAYMNSVKK